MLLERFINWLEKISGPKSILIMVMILIPFNLLFFPWVNRQLDHLSGYQLLDSRFAYTPAEAVLRLDAYSGAGRTLYLVNDWTFDLAYPVIYSLLAGFILTLVLKVAFPPLSPLQRMQLFPFCMAFFDYLENISISLLLILFPGQPNWLIQVASASTTLKWCFAGFSIFALLAGLVGWGYSALRQPRY